MFVLYTHFSADVSWIRRLQILISCSAADLQPWKSNLASGQEVGRMYCNLLNKKNKLFIHAQILQASTYKMSRTVKKNVSSFFFYQSLNIYILFSISSD